MDTTLVYNQVKVPTDINATIENLSNIPDSITVVIKDVVNVAHQTVEPDTFWGLTTEWGAIVIPTVATIVVFVVGILIDRVYKRHRGVEQTKAYRNTVFAWVELIKTPVQAQIARLNKLSRDIHQNNTLQNVRFEFSKSMADKLELVSADNIIQHFIFNSSVPKEDKRAQYAYNIVSLFDFLSSVENEIRVNYETYQIQSQSLMNEWNPTIIHLQNFIQSCHPSAVEMSMFKQIEKAFLHWKQQTENDEEVDLVRIKDLLVSQIQKICSKHTLGQEGFSNIDIVVNDAKMLLLIYNKWSTLNKGFEIVFANYANSIKDSYNSLCNAIRYLKENTRPTK